jgi:hypothetical protein
LISLREPEANMNFRAGSRAVQLFENQMDFVAEQELLKLLMVKRMRFAESSRQGLDYEGIF